MAQFDARVYSHDVLNAEEIAAVLSVARCNVSPSPKELQGSAFVKVTHLGDRTE